MAYDRDAQLTLNRQHIANPQKGDYWEDHMVACFYVLEVVHGFVLFFDEKNVTDTHWDWDLTKPKALLLDDFAKRLRYQSETMSHRTWCDVHPNREL